MDLIAIFQYLKYRYEEEGGFLFIRTCMENTRGNGYKLQGERFHLHIRKKFFTVNNLPRDVVEFARCDCTGY